jgi:hypothetical protein
MSGKEGCSTMSTFALHQRIHLRLRIAQRKIPFDAVDVDELAAGGARGRFLARHVLGVLQVDRLVAGLEFVALEDVGPRADVVLDLLEGIRVRDALGHDERHVGGGLADRLEHEAAGLAQEDAEGIGAGVSMRSMKVKRATPIASRLPQRVQRGGQRPRL